MYSDFHNDILTYRSGELPKEYYDNNIITAVFRGNRSFKDALKLAEKAVLPAFEDVGYEDLDIDELLRIKPLYVTLTWNGENRFGFGCDFDSDKGLKPEGKAFIKILNENGIAVDCAHISKGGFKDIIESAENVVNSHTCFSALHKHKRNLDDWQLDELASRGALVGATCCGYFMTNEKHCKISDFIREIDYFSEKYGCDNLAIGTDFYGCDFCVEDTFDYEKLYALTSSELSGLGYRKDEIDKVLFKNLLKFTKNSHIKQTAFD